MKSGLWIFPAGALALFLASCGTKSGDDSYQAVTGPFDSQGNYIEEWADNPAKWNKSGNSFARKRAKDTAVALADSDVPQVAVSEQPPGNAVPLDPGSRGGVTTTTTASRPKPKTTSSSSTASVSKPKPKTTVAKTATSKPKPKAPVKKKPASTRYVVKKGDTLSGIASRTGSSVNAIRRANSISGSLIRPGQSLVIPR